MQIKTLRGLVGSYGNLRRGAVVEIPDHVAEKLVKRGLAVPTQAEKKGAAERASARPSRTGGRGGKAKPSSSSPEGPAPKTRTSIGPEGEPA